MTDEYIEHAAPRIALGEPLEQAMQAQVLASGVQGQGAQHHAGVERTHPAERWWSPRGGRSLHRYVRAEGGMESATIMELVWGRERRRFKKKEEEEEQGGRDGKRRRGMSMIDSEVLEVATKNASDQIWQLPSNWNGRAGAEGSGLSRTHCQWEIEAG
ncbi:hypothetical protein BJY52DRAFT_1226928 [Lactarius psammicola]|nr:hypothetical protein BJY52DRAFT_1226928 [Lactarius psammicola]